MPHRLPEFQEKVLYAIRMLNNRNAEPTPYNIKKEMGVSLPASPDARQTRIGALCDRFHVNGAIKKGLVSAFATPARDEVAEAIAALMEKKYVSPAWLASENDPDQKPGTGPTIKYSISYSGRKYLNTIDRCVQDDITEPQTIEYLLSPGL